MATAGEASREHNDFTPDPLGTDEIRPGYRRQEQPMATGKGSHNGANPYEDTAVRVWTFSVASGTWSIKVRFPSEKGFFAPVEIRMTRSRTVDGWTLEGLDPDPIETGIVSVSEAIEAVRERIDVVTLTPETAAALEEPTVVVSGLHKVEPKGAWLVTDQWSTITVFLREIDALRFVNEGAASGKDVEKGKAAFFVPDGKTLSDARGW